MSFQVFSNREDMIRKMVKEGWSGCELGVFAGEFAESLARRNPTQLYLIDCWKSDDGFLFSGDVDGNNGVNLPCEYLYSLVIGRFHTKSNIQILRGWTWECIPMIPDGSLDYVYIDADHSYEGVKRDLQLIFPKLKPKALIMGHDYEMNFEKAKIPWKFGVKEAVDEFCKEKDYCLVAKAMDGCVSFCLQRRLDSFSSSTSTPANL